MTTKVFDAAKYLETEDDVVTFLDATLEEGDASHIANTLGIISRSQGMTEIAKRTGVKR